MKRFDINRPYIDAIVKAYQEFSDESYDINGKVCESKIFDSCQFGYVKIGIIAPELDAAGNPKKNSRGKIIYDKSKNDTEKIPLRGISLSPKRDLLKDLAVKQLIEEHMQKEVRPYVQFADIDPKKVSIGFEIPFTRHFYKYTPPRPSEEIMAEIEELNAKINDLMQQLTESLAKKN